MCDSTSEVFHEGSVLKLFDQLITKIREVKGCIKDIEDNFDLIQRFLKASYECPRHDGNADRKRLHEELKETFPTTIQLENNAKILNDLINTCVHNVPYIASSSSSDESD